MLGVEVVGEGEVIVVVLVVVVVVVGVVDGGVVVVEEVVVVLEIGVEMEDEGVTVLIALLLTYCTLTRFDLTQMDYD